MRTKVKFCGLTRESDIQSAVSLGVDALGFVFYPASQRYVTGRSAEILMRKIPAFISTVGLFVNESIESMQHILKVAPVTIIQLHGDESWEFTVHALDVLQKPIIKAIRVNDDTDWDEVVFYSTRVSGVLLDADAMGYGGAGQVFDWSLIPAELRHKVILSGGLKYENVAQALNVVQPYALDVSSGIESEVKGQKNAEKMQLFMEAVNLYGV